MQVACDAKMAGLAWDYLTALFILTHQQLFASIQKQGRLRPLRPIRSHADDECGGEPCQLQR